MPELSVTDEQFRRLEAVCEDLEAAYVGPYGSVQPDDALEYLLDTYTPPGEGDAPTGEGEGEDEDTADDAGATPTPDAGDADADANAGDGVDDLTIIEGVGEVTAEALVEAGFDSLADIEAADPASLTAAEGVGEKQAVDIVAAVAEMDGATTDGAAAEAGDDGAGGEAATGDGPGAGDPASKSPEDTLQQAMSLLDAHDDRWRESSGDEPYEVDLPDGSTEAVRTKDDVRRLLFKHWK